MQTITHPKVNSVDGHESDSESLNSSDTDSGSESTDDSEYEVETILGKEKRLDEKYGRIGWHYLIKWKGFDDIHNSWEPSRNVNPEVIDQYEQQFIARGSRRSRGRGGRAPPSTPVRTTRASRPSTPGRPSSRGRTPANGMYALRNRLGDMTATPKDIGFNIDDFDDWLKEEKEVKEVLPEAEVQISRSSLKANIWSLIQLIGVIAVALIGLFGLLYIISDKLV